MKTRRALLILASCLLTAGAGEIPEKAERYRAMLLKKPENPVLFGRMLDAWLEEMELEALEPELELRAAEGAAADWRLLAVFHQHGGAEEEALKALDEAVKLAPDDAAVRLARGKALGGALRFEAALEDLEIAARDEQLGVEAGTLRGKILARSGRPAEAVKAWQELIAKNPADEGLKEDLIELEIGEGMLEEAVTAARELAASTEDPYKKALRRLHVAEILAQAGKKPEALEEYRQVFAVSADGSWLEREVLARSGMLFAREDDSAGLKGFLDALREEYPRRVAVKKEAAKSLLVAGEVDEAIAMFREVLKVLPGDREVREEFIALLEGAGRHQDAADETTALLEIAKNDAALWERLAVLKKELNDPVGVDEALTRATALLPDDESGLVARARLAERFDQLAKAEKQLREAVAIHGQAGEAAESLAGFLVAHNKSDEAVAMWKQMAAEADREGLLRIARSLSAHGKAAEAFAILQPRMADFPNDPLLLSALCQAAQLSDDPELAVPQALELVRQAESPTDLDTALRQATALISRAENPRQWLDQLAANPKLTIQERCLLSELHESFGDSIQAEKVLRDAEAEDEILLATTQRVRLHEMRGDFDGAVVAMREMMALPGGAKTAHAKRLVELLERAGDFDEALAETASWMKIAPGDKLVWTKRAELFLGEGRPTEAVAELRRALAKFGGDEELRALLANAQREAGMMEESWRNFTALYEEAESPSAKLKWISSLAQMASMEGKEDELMSDFRRRARDNPSSPLPLLALAEIHRAWQDPEEELKCVAEASRRRPEDATLKFRVADLEENLGNSEAAAAILRGMLGGPAATDARRRLSAFWIRQGETERGLRELAALGQGGDPRVIEKLVMLLVKAKDWEAAADVVEREFAAHADDWRLAYFRAVILMEAGRKEEAFERFAALLDAEGELEGLTPVALAGIMPGQPARPGAPQNMERKTILVLRSVEQQATAYRHPDQYRYSGVTPGEVALPTSPEQVRLMALAQALVMCRETEDDRHAMLAKLTSRHFDDLDALKQVVFLAPEELKELLLSDAATPAMFEWYLRDSYSQQNGPDQEVLRRGIELASESEPRLALMLASRFGIGGENGLGEETARKLLDRFKELGDEERAQAHYLLQMIAFAGEGIPADLAQEAESLMIEEIQKMPGGMTSANHYASTLPLQWFRVGRYDDAIAWINRLQAPEEGPPGVRLPHQQQMMLQISRMQQRGQFPLLAYPQILSELVPSAFREMMRRDVNPEMTEVHRELIKLLGEEVQDSRLQQQPIDPEALAEAASELTDPLMRVLFYQNAERTEEVAREMAAILKSETPKSEHLLLAAAYEISIGKSQEKAYEILVRARELPDSGLWRGRIDSELVTQGAAIAQDGEADLDLEPARRAVLRLRKQMSFNPNQRTQLADQMTKLGLEEEAKRFVAGPVIAASGRNFRTSSSGSILRSGRLPQEEVARLVRDGKRYAAARKVLMALRQNAGNSNEDYLNRQILSLATSLKLQEDLAKLDAPSETAGFNRRKAHAMLLMRLENPETALPWLRKLAQEKPEDAEVKTALYTVLPADERAAQLKDLAAGEIDTEALATLFTPALQANDVKGRLDAVESMVELLQALTPSYDGSRNLTWINYHIKQVVTEDYQSVQLSSLFNPAQNSGREVDEAASSRRIELSRQMFRAMLRHPQTAEQGFILLYATREALETSTEELDQAAVAAVREVMREEVPENQGGHRYRRADGLWVWIQGNGSSSSGGPPSGSLQPSDYISRRAAEGVELKPFDAPFIAELAAGSEERAKTLERCTKVVRTAGDEEFLRWKKQAAERPLEVGKELIWIAHLAGEAKRDDLLPLIEEFACDYLRENQGSLPEFGEIAARAVTREADQAGRMAALERLTKRILGPEEAWPLYVQIGDRYHIPQAAQRTQAYRTLMSGLQGDALATISAIRFINRHQLGTVAYVDWSVVSQMINQKPAVADLLASGLFSFGPEVLGSFQQGANASLFDQTIAYLRNWGETKKLGEELLQAEGDNRFWGRIAGAILSENLEPAYRELDREVEAILNWPDAARFEFARFVTTTLPEASDKTKVSMKRLLAEGLAKGDEDARQAANEYLEKGLPDNMHPWSLGDSLHPLIARLIPNDPELAVTLWDKSLKDFRSGNRGSSSSGGYTVESDSYAHAELLEHLMSRSAIPDVCHFLGLLEKQEAAAFLGLTERNFGYRLRARFESEAQTRAAVIAKDKNLEKLPEGGRAFAGLISGLTRDTQESARPVLAALIVNYYQETHNGNPKQTREGAIEWARTGLKKLDPVIANSAVLSLLAKDSANLDEAGKAELRTAYAEFISNNKIPVGLRMASLVGFHALKDVLDDPATAKATTGMLIEYITPDRAWASSNTVATVNAFADWSHLQAEDASRVIDAVAASRINFASGNDLEARAAVATLNLSLAVRSGNAEVISKAVQGGGDAVRGRLDLAVDLWQSGIDGAAVQLLARPGEYHKGARSLFFNQTSQEFRTQRFSKEIETALPDWLAAIPDAGQRFRIECLISSFEDGIDEAAPSTQRLQRLTALAARFPAEGPKPRASQLETLAALAVLPDAARSLAPELANVIRAHDLGSIVLTQRSNSNRNPGVTEENHVIEALIRAAMQYPIDASGDASELIRQVESLHLFGTGEYEYLARNMMNFFGPYSALLVRRIVELEGDPQAAAAAQSLKLCELLLSFDNSMPQREAIALGAASQAAAGDGAALDRWLEGLPANLKERFKEARNSSGLRQVFFNLRHDPLSQEKFPDQRLALVKAILGDPATVAREIQHPTELSSLMDSQVLSRDELFAAIDAMPEDHPQRPEFLTEKAGIIGWRTYQFDEALKAYDAADAAAEASGEAKSIAYARSYRAAFLDHRQNKTAEAAAIAKELDLDLLGEKERKWMEELLAKAAAQ